VLTSVILLLPAKRLWHEQLIVQATQRRDVRRS
jgi:hypothetical protein